MLMIKQVKSSKGAQAVPRARRATAVAAAGEPAPAAPAERGPVQGRSQASLKRMLAAARNLMLERDGEDFTLNDVSMTGKVSIGSIYHRFASKDDLVRAVLEAEMKEIEAGETLVQQRSLEQSRSLDQFISLFIRDFFEVLKKHSLFIRLNIRRAATDPAAAMLGDTHEQRAAQRLHTALTVYAADIPGDLDRKASYSMLMIFFALAWQLTPEMPRPTKPQQHPDWVIIELCTMITSYLKN
ncbi:MULTISPECIES: TetR/AcrR family transcriptional regulator [unclassified Azospirillum]|uniref:TetR/AcrR family transcriptional regulator n=1 Tax=unclassified Azospirillum TaxID=2630922 RepID=UPI000B755653|nr:MULTISPECIES: TetR/AcrR family transcriptional regulator [unclassified Azospirillum]SNS51456.1 transcriptional regulator, TetR family [Azospirillum sp. RU38E]SNS70097.1 transcriptional regulator, TetR family [Azospirillum sp. RU37A]